jgi:hypothetical protein
MRICVGVSGNGDPDASKSGTLSLDPPQPGSQGHGGGSTSPAGTAVPEGGQNKVNRTFGHLGSELLASNHRTHE